MAQSFSSSVFALAVVQNKTFIRKCIILLKYSLNGLKYIIEIMVLLVRAHYISHGMFAASLNRVSLHSLVTLKIDSQLLDFYCNFLANAI